MDVPEAEGLPELIGCGNSLITETVSKHNRIQQKQSTKEHDTTNTVRGQWTQRAA